MSTDNVSLSTCANCGKGEEENGHLKKCGACEMVKYCNAECQKAHRPQHKKECRLRAAELHGDKLFKQPPLEEECPICFIRMPSLETGRKYMTCCGKIICCGCLHAGALVGDDELCPFCRAPYVCRTPGATSDGEIMKRVKKRVEVNDAWAMCSLGCYYDEGKYGMPQDHAKALGLWHRAAELGNANSYCSIGYAYFNGEGVARDEKKAKHYWELAAIGGNEHARHNLGTFEARSGNYDRALKHYMIAVGSGDNNSLKRIKQMYTNGHAKKDDYAKALQAYQAYLAEIKSDDRDKAAAFDDEHKYYE